MSLENTPRIRRAPFPDDAVIVIRGEARNPDESRNAAEQFRRRFEAWERWGVSGFYARGEIEVDDIASSRLRRFELMRIYLIADLVVAGFEVVGTFRSPHVTIAWTSDLEQGLARLDSAAHIERVNPYHGSQPEDSP